MRFLLFLFQVFLIFLPKSYLIGQSGNWEWAKSSTGVTPPGTFTNHGYTVATDSAGNTYVTGFFKTPNITFGTTTLTNAGINKADIFLVKYDKNGNCKWAKSSGGTDSDMPGSVATDNYGNVYLTGSYGSTSISFDTTTFTITGYTGFFLVKYDSLGNVIWAKNQPGTCSASGYAVSVDIAGNIYVSGSFSSFSCPSVTFGTTVLTSMGGNEIFLAKFDNNGNVLWATSVGGINHEYDPNVTIDNLGNVYLCGYFFSPSMIIGSTTLTNMGSNDLFISKYDSLGNVIWAKGIGGTSGEYPRDIATDSDGIFIVGGYRSPTLSFDAVTLINNSTVNLNIFIAKLDFTGNTLWAKSAGGINQNEATSITTDFSGIYITGFSNDSLLILDGLTLSFPGEYSTLFVSKYNSNGSILCATVLKNKINTSRAGIAVDKLGNAFVCSNYSESPFIVGSDTLSDAGGWSQQVFLAKYSCAVTGNSIKEIERSNNFILYPNPSSTQITISSKTSLTNTSIKIINPTGQALVHKNNISGNSFTLDVSGQPTGLYFLEINEDGKISRIKFVRE